MAKGSTWSVFTAAHTFTVRFEFSRRIRLTPSTNEILATSLNGTSAPVGVIIRTLSISLIELRSSSG